LKNIDSYLSQKDPVLGQIIDSINLQRPVSTKSVFHDLLSCIIEQQIHYRSTKKTFFKLLQKADLEKLTVENFHLLEENGLGELKLSNNKFETIQQILEYWRQGEINWEGLNQDEVRKKLGVIKGVGSWTIDMILLYTLGYADVFPADDYHLKKAMTRLYNLNPKKLLKGQMKSIAKKWSPNSSAAVLYLLQWNKEK
jgi:DNA-3-methyladenine glycosylase II